MPLGQTVYAVVKEADVKVHIAADTVNEMVASYGETVAVACHLPYCEVRVGGFHASGNCCAATVYGVEPVGGEIVRHTA